LDALAKRPRGSLTLEHLIAVCVERAGQVEDRRQGLRGVEVVVQGAVKARGEGGDLLG